MNNEGNINQKICEVKYDCNPFIHEKTAKSEGKIGNITIVFTKSFNWFQRLMWKVCFGLEIKNLKENIENENND